MALWNTIGGDIKQFGGRLKGGDTTFNGVKYNWKSLWDSDEHIDSFLEEFGDRIEKSDRGFVEKVLTFYFTVK